MITINFISYHNNQYKTWLKVEQMYETGDALRSKQACIAHVFFHGFVVCKNFYT